MRVSTPFPSPRLGPGLCFCLFAWVSLTPGHGFAQSPMSRSEKLAQKVRIAYLEATTGIHVPTLSVDSLLAHLQDSDWVLIDVREDKEIAVSRLPGSLSPAEFSGVYRYTGFPKTKSLVTYCTIGYRSGKFAEQLLAKGLPVRNLEGGLLAWVGQKGPLVRKAMNDSLIPTTQVHVYAKEWNLLPPGYQAQW